MNRIKTILIWVFILFLAKLSFGVFKKLIAPSNKDAIKTGLSSETYFIRGSSNFEKGEYDRAIENYTKAIELNPNNAIIYQGRGLAVVYLGRGTSYVYKGEYDRAIENYTKAIELDPKYVFAYGARGGSYAKKGKYNKAIEDYNKAIELDPKDVFAYSGRGRVYYYTDEYKKALSDFNMAIKLNPEFLSQLQSYIDEIKQKGY